jgi:hypothetical protein
MNDKDQSELTFGGFDKNKFEGSLSWHPVRVKFFWTLKLNDIKYNGKPLHICKDKECLVTPDSGTSLLTAPSWGYNILMDTLP